MLSDRESPLDHHLKELENDLIGNFFEVNNASPNYQFLMPQRGINNSEKWSGQYLKMVEKIFR